MEREPIKTEIDPLNLYVLYCNECSFNLTRPTELNYLTLVAEGHKRVTGHELTLEATDAGQIIDMLG